MEPAPEDSEELLNLGNGFGEAHPAGMYEGISSKSRKGGYINLCSKHGIAHFPLLPHEYAILL